MTLQDQFDVFLCHNSKDKAEIKQIGQQLKQQGLQPWLDEWEFRPGLPWQKELERQIELETLRHELEEYAMALAVIAGVDYSF